MKQLILLLIFLYKFSVVFAQNDQWTWIDGDSTINRIGMYRTQGVADSINQPGAKVNAVSWKDASNNLWLFGGYGYTTSGGGYFNDLWKYTPLTGQWIWMNGDSTINQTGVYGIRGVPASTNKPGARQNAVSWTDATGNIWMFGGLRDAPAYQDGYLNDLWKYDPSSNQWTWVSGDSTIDQPSVYGTLGIAASSNEPGTRVGGVGWTDAFDNLWLFGGLGYAGKRRGGDLNDLWKYTPSTGLWTWISGDSTINQNGVYGIKGTAASTNKPGARGYPANWTDDSGNFWFFGGSGYASISSSVGPLNDLWKYAPATGQWTWVHGDNNVGSYGIYGNKGTASMANKPGARSNAVNGKDAAGNFWMFGGNGFTARNGGGLGDLWKYTLSTGQWTWINGDSTPNHVKVYGMQGIATPNNEPGAMSGAISWTDASSNLWIFGGAGYNSSGLGYFNDLWKYSISTVTLPVQISSFTVQKQQRKALLNWTTAREQSSRHFVVERSMDNAVYDSIGNVFAIGSSSSTIEYTFTDKVPIAGTNFYRLKVNLQLAPPQEIDFL